MNTIQFYSLSTPQHYSLELMSQIFKYIFLVSGDMECSNTWCYILYHDEKVLA